MGHFGKSLNLGSQCTLSLTSEHFKKRIMNIGFLCTLYTVIRILGATPLHATPSRLAASLTGPVSVSQSERDPFQLYVSRFSFTAAPPPILNNSTNYIFFDYSTSYVKHERKSSRFIYLYSNTEILEFGIVENKSFEFIQRQASFSNTCQCFKRYFQFVRK